MSVRVMGDRHNNAELVRDLHTLWEAHCQGVDLRTLRALARPVWVLCGGGGE